MAWALLTKTEDLIRREAVRDIRSHLVASVTQGLSSEDLTSPLDGARYEDLDAKLRSCLTGHDIRRIKVWNRDAVVVYSSLREQVGESSPLNPGLRQSLAGAVSYDVTEEPESAFEAGMGPLLEAYIPLTWTGDSRPDAVLEVYLDYTPYVKFMESLRRGVVIAAALAFLTMPIALYVLYRVGWAQFRREHAEAAQRAVEVEALNALLQNDIANAIELREGVIELQREMALGLPAPDDPGYEARVDEIRRQVAALAAHAEAFLSVPKKDAEAPERPDEPDPSRERDA